MSTCQRSCAAVVRHGGRRCALASPGPPGVSAASQYLSVKPAQPPVLSTSMAGAAALLRLGLRIGVVPLRQPPVQDAGEALMQDEEARGLRRALAPDARPGQHLHRLGAAVQHGLPRRHHEVLVERELDAEHLALLVVPGQRHRRARRQFLPIRRPVGFRPRHHRPAIRRGPAPLGKIGVLVDPRREQPHQRTARLHRLPVATQHQVVQPCAAQTDAALQPRILDPHALLRRQASLRHCGGAAWRHQRRAAGIDAGRCGRDRHIRACRRLAPRLGNRCLLCGDLRLSALLRLPRRAVPQVEQQQDADREGDGGEETLLVHDGLIQPFVGRGPASGAGPGTLWESGGTGS
jgi:hypothetical protein